MPLALHPTTQLDIPRRLHPAGTEGAERVLPIRDLAVIADGLAQGSATGVYMWTDAGDRRYTTLIETDLYNAWLIEWSPSSKLDLHDHGGSAAAVKVVEGCLVESYAHRLRPQSVQTRSVAAGDMFAVPSTRIHAVANPGPGLARSVHVYSPPLAEVRMLERN